MRPDAQDMQLKLRFLSAIACMHQRSFCQRQMLRLRHVLLVVIAHIGCRNVVLLVASMFSNRQRVGVFTRRPRGWSCRPPPIASVLQKTFANNAHVPIGTYYVWWSYH